MLLNVLIFSYIFAYFQSQFLFIFSLSYVPANYRHNNYSYDENNYVSFDDIWNAEIVKIVEIKGLAVLCLIMKASTKRHEQIILTHTSLIYLVVDDNLRKVVYTWILLLLFFLCKDDIVILVNIIIDGMKWSIDTLGHIPYVDSVRFHQTLRTIFCEFSRTLIIKCLHVSKVVSDTCFVYTFLSYRFHNYISTCDWVALVFWIEGAIRTLPHTIIFNKFVRFRSEGDQVRLK